MKKLLLLMSLCACMGCTAYEPSEFNKQQTLFIRFMRSLSDEYRKSSNDVIAQYDTANN